MSRNLVVCRDGASNEPGFGVPHRITTKLTLNLLAVLVLACVLLAAEIHETVAVADRSSVGHLPKDLVAVHDCWTGEAPDDMQGRNPGHVVVTTDGRTRYAGARTVTKALSQVFEGVDHGLTVHAFCR